MRGEKAKRSDERQRRAVLWRCPRLRVVIPSGSAVEEAARERCPARTCGTVSSGGKATLFYPAAAGPRSDEERLDFLVLRRYVRRNRAPSFCLLDFEHLSVALEQLFACLEGRGRGVRLLSPVRTDCACARAECRSPRDASG